MCTDLLEAGVFEVPPLIDAILNAELVATFPYATVD